MIWRFFDQRASIQLTGLPVPNGFLRHVQKGFPHLPRFVEALRLDGLAEHGALEEFNLSFHFIDTKER